MKWLGIALKILAAIAALLGGAQGTMIATGQAPVDGFSVTATAGGILAGIAAWIGGVIVSPVGRTTVLRSIDLLLSFMKKYIQDWVNGKTDAKQDTTYNALVASTFDLLRQVFYDNPAALKLIAELQELFVKDDQNDPPLQPVTGPGVQLRN